MTIHYSVLICVSVPPHLPFISLIYYLVDDQFCWLCQRTSFWLLDFPYCLSVSLNSTLIFFFFLYVLYAGYCECYVVETRYLYIPLKSVVIFVLAGNYLDLIFKLKTLLHLWHLKFQFNFWSLCILQGLGQNLYIEPEITLLWLFSELLVIFI